MLLIFRNNLEIDGFYTWHFQKAQYLTEWGKKNIPIYQINKKKKNQSRTTEDEVKVGTTDGTNGAIFTEQDPHIWDLQLLVTPFVHVNVPECCENVC